MAKKKKQIIISPFSKELIYFNIYKIYKDKSKVFRCKYCYKSKIKKINEIYIKITGHIKNCKIFKNKNKRENKSHSINNNIINNKHNDNKDNCLNKNIYKKKS